MDDEAIGDSIRRMCCVMMEAATQLIEEIAFPDERLRLGLMGPVHGAKSFQNPLVQRWGFLTPETMEALHLTKRAINHVMHFVSRPGLTCIYFAQVWDLLHQTAAHIVHAREAVRYARAQPGHVYQESLTAFLTDGQTQNAPVQAFLAENVEANHGEAEAAQRANADSSVPQAVAQAMPAAQQAACVRL